MGETQQVQMQIMVQEEADSTSVTSRSKHYKWWLRISVYILCVLLGQAGAVLLGRLYFTKGGKSKWIATLVQLIGFPILIPYYLFLKLKNPTQNDNLSTKSPSPLIISTAYILFGLVIAADCFLYSIGMQYLPVSTYTLISASQLAFNAFFSYFLNSLKLTPCIINSLVLLTISSVLLVFNKESETPNGVSVSKVKYATGFICTVGASAGCGLALSLTQLFVKKVIKQHNFKVVMELVIYPAIVATMTALVALFLSGEWKNLAEEMNGYQLGKVSYLMNLIWTGIIWQICLIGNIGLIMEVSCLFSNAISVVGLPIVPVLSVLVFHDKMDGIKAISMVLAMWGFLSYVYQHYIDDRKEKDGTKMEIGKLPVLQIEEK